MNFQQLINAQIKIVLDTWVTAPYANTPKDVFPLHQKIDQAHALFGLMAEKRELREADGDEERLSEAGDVFYYLIASLLAFDHPLENVVDDLFYPADAVVPPGNHLISYAQKYFRGKQEYQEKIIKHLLQELKLFEVYQETINLTEVVAYNRKKLASRLKTNTIIR